MNYERMRWDREPLVAKAIEFIVAASMDQLERELRRCEMNERPLNIDVWLRNNRPF